jgi:drug/metabolite transporter (DMT)-like permease
VDAVAILSGFAFAMTNLCFRASPELPVPSKIAALFLGCLLFALLLLASGVQAFPAVGRHTVLLAMMFGIGGLLLATSGTQWAVTKMEAGRSSIVMVMELVAAVASAALIAGDRMSMMEMQGGALILGATLMEAWFATGDAS